MKAVAAWWKLPWADKALFFEALAVVIVSRTLLTVVPFRKIFAWSQRLEKRRAPLPPSPETDSLETQLAHWVRVAAKRVPAASCLTQALALQFLLARRGDHSELRIGVAKGEETGFRAHAWLVTRQGVVIGGGRQLNFYTPILSQSGQK